MNHAPREVAAESYPTFWDDARPQPVLPPVAPEAAYTAFVDLTEEEFPSGEYPLDRREPDPDAAPQPNG
jgi:hypothetical protein